MRSQRALPVPRRADVSAPEDRLAEQPELLDISPTVMPEVVVKADGIDAREAVWGPR